MFPLSPLFVNLYSLQNRFYLENPITVPYIDIYSVHYELKPFMVWCVIIYVVHSGKSSVRAEDVSKVRVSFLKQHYT